MKSIHIVEDTLPVAWEKAVLKCWEQGDTFKTEYDKPNDPPSRDVTLMMHVTNPMKEPRIHRAFPGGLNDLEKYRAEVLYGVHDHWVNPAEGKWEYTYHQRLFEYDVPSIGTFNQIDNMISKLKEAGHTRRAQAVTWKVWDDYKISDPACLQQIWCRVENNKLNMNIFMRSNDGYKAAFENAYAFIELQKYIADHVGVEVGEYIHMADSFHIYGSYFEEFKGFLETVQSRDMKDRVWTSDFAKDFFIDGCEELLTEDDMPDDRKQLVRDRLSYLKS